MARHPVQRVAHCRRHGIAADYRIAFGTHPIGEFMKLAETTMDEFPNSVASARELAEAWLSDPDMWWNETVDLLVFGLERMLERRRD